jgi:uncharacterized protein
MPHGNAFWTLYLYLEATILLRLFREWRMIKQFVAQRKFFEITEYLRRTQWYWFVMAFIFPLPFILYFPFHLIRKGLYRNHSRRCKLCDGKMKKLSEKEEDQFLTEHQQLEEQLHSVNYDVWQCAECGGAESWHFRNRLTSYRECPACKSIAYHVHGDRTIVSATYTKSGRGEMTYRCKACGKETKEEYSIALLTTSSSSSSSSSSGGSSWSSSSSSSSSGGSWGGGRSGGGGASSSW